MNDIWAERRLRGYSKPPYPVGPWQDFEPEPLWAESELKVRFIFAAECVQFKGLLRGPFGIGLSVIGTLEAPFRPRTSHTFILQPPGARRGEVGISPPGLVVWIRAGVGPVNGILHAVWPV